MRKFHQLTDDKLRAALDSLGRGIDSTDMLMDPAKYDLRFDLHELYLTDEYDEPYVVLGISDRRNAFSTGFSDDPSACTVTLTLPWK